ncbi:MAG: RNA polymerase factor sigma-54 [Nitrospirae bacterium]|nr:RNA polymerase factor sigma-54 [Nitrospirota bacterium]
MALQNRLEIKLGQKLVLTPQLQMAIKLLQMPQLELSQTLTTELTENPFLEESVENLSLEELSSEEKDSLEPADDDRDDAELPLEGLASFTTDDYFDERRSDGRDLGYFTPGTTTHPSFEYYLSTAPDLYDHLIMQLRHSRDEDDVRRVAEVIIGNIDEKGYLLLHADELQQTSQSTPEIVQEALMLVQSFDPPGIAARDLRECLQLQLRPLNLTGTLVETLILSHLELISRKKYQQVAKTCNVTLEEIMAAVKVIEGLNPKPARSFSTDATNYITPDVYIFKTDEGYQIVLNDEGMPKLRINSYYLRLLQQKNLVPKEERHFLEEKLRAAKDLIKSLDHRNKTIYRVTECILNYQKDFFEAGVSHLRPLNLKDIATELNLHESTVSRVTSTKYLACPRGIYGFKYFFSNAIPSDSGELSSTSVKDMIKTIILEEAATSPLSDMKIVDIFKSKNITIARRTIAKYREELKIPPQSQRRR